MGASIILSRGDRREAPCPERSAREDEEMCLCCDRNQPAGEPRVCPILECSHEFQGNGWDGLDAHWRAHHEGVMTYEEFRNSLCEAHRGPHMVR